MNKWSNYGKWRHPEKRKELMKIDIKDFNRKAQHIIDTVVNPQVERYEQSKKQEETITKEKKMTEEELQNFPQMMSSKMASQQQLINLLYSQVVDLTMMSKIELGDDVIAEIKRLNDIINE